MSFECPNCKNSIPLGSNKCRNCGFDLELYRLYVQIRLHHKSTSAEFEILSKKLKAQEAKLEEFESLLTGRLGLPLPENGEKVEGLASDVRSDEGEPAAASQSQPGSGSPRIQRPGGPRPNHRGRR